MSDSKIKIKDLAAELKMDAKELLQELQSMGFNVKSAQGSIPMEEVSGVRDRVAENRQRKADRKDDQPTVIVRRRRVKDEVPAEEQAAAAPEKAAAPVETPAARVISVPEAEKAPEGKPEPAKAEPGAEKTPEPAAPVETPAARVVAAPEAEKAPEAKPEPVKNEAKAETRPEARREARAAKATPQTARVVAPAGARVISRPDATPTARIIRPAQAATPVTRADARTEPKPEKAPEAKPEVRKSAVLAAINAKEAAENGAAEKAARSRAGRPDASAMPEGSSAPTLLQREARENRDERPAEATPTRAMIVAMLARLENVTSAESAGFTDVAADDWYATAVNWAASEGIVGGFGDDTFAPNDPITREQLAAMLMKYAQYKGLDTTARADLSGYTDAPSTWASEAVQWAVAEGLLAGVTDDQLQPQGQATRAQVAAIFERFLEA